MTPTQLRRLRAFHLVMQTGSVTQASEALAMSQPAISKLLQALETDIQLALFDRSRRRLVPTMDARRFHKEVERLFQAAGDLDRVANEIRAAGVGELRVGALPALGMSLLPQWLTEMRRLHPRLRISLTTMLSRTLVESVRVGEIDVGVVMAFGNDPAFTRCASVKLPGVAVLPNSHRLAKAKSLKPRDFEAERFVSLGRQDRARELVDSLFEAHGVSRSLEVETNLGTCACALVADGVGVSLVDPVSPKPFLGRLQVRRIQPSVNFPLEVITRVGQPPSAIVDQFLTIARSALISLQAEMSGV